MDRHATVSAIDTSTYQESQEWKVTVTVLPAMVRIGYVGAEARDLPVDVRAALRAWLDKADA